MSLTRIRVHRVLLMYPISGQFEEIFLNKVDFGHFPYLVKLLQFGLDHPHFRIFFITYEKIKLRKAASKSEVPQGMFIL